jgi:hypothetical protein
MRHSGVSRNKKFLKEKRSNKIRIVMIITIIVIIIKIAEAVEATLCGSDRSPTETHRSIISKMGRNDLKKKLKH